MRFVLCGMAEKAQCRAPESIQRRLRTLRQIAIMALGIKTAVAHTLVHGARRRCRAGAHYAVTVRAGVIELA
ncbi:hypothetical protein J8I26_04555 [Herbaspirillum sp. LeCh32-8]|uniref:hypothetical protein n=1 Tax=Herbaspirillum sp. LeCh32-8 TaxID=2821356 RepID=UPI001AE3985E|nr:hypothetical protein [Herbaspirillum sp. LeCh32-8]MBP0597362.1 hypothetical protein [Herbaspirillum sp. LeCh32-8]